jgi:Spy/CpxP family protein refolding chaperone
VEQLKLTAEQKTKLREVQSEHYADMRESFREKRNLPQEELFKAIRRWQLEQKPQIRKQVEEILSPKQMEMLNEITCQTNAFQYLSGPHSRTLAKLAVTEEQQDKLRSLQSEMENQARRVRQEKSDKILAVLNPQQRAQFREEAFGPDGPSRYLQTTIEVAGDIGKIYVPALAPYPDFTKEDVQKVLDLTPQQNKQVQELLGEASNLAEKLVEEWQKLSPAERKERRAPGAFDAIVIGGNFRSEEERKRMETHAREVWQKKWAARRQDPVVKANAELLRQFVAILTPEQLAHYKDMAFRTLLVERLFNEISLQKIGATDQQVEALQKLFEELAETYHRLARETGAKMLNVLTPAQREQVCEELLSAAP